MQVIEHQFLHYRNVLSYITQIDDDDISFFVVGVKNNICVLDLKLNGKIVFTKKDNFMEFVIPVNKKFTSNQHYEFKSEFKLVNAVRARHYGSFSTIKNKVDDLKAYIEEHSLTPVTQPYYMIQDCKNEIYDVFIGISENIL